MLLHLLRLLQLHLQPHHLWRRSRRQVCVAAPWGQPLASTMRTGDDGDDITASCAALSHPCRQMRTQCLARFAQPPPPPCAYVGILLSLRTHAAQLFPCALLLLVLLLPRADPAPLVPPTNRGQAPTCNVPCCMCAPVHACMRAMALCSRAGVPG